MGMRSSKVQKENVATSTPRVGEESLESHDQYDSYNGDVDKLEDAKIPNNHRVPMALEIMIADDHDPYELDLEGDSDSGSEMTDSASGEEENEDAEPEPAVIVTLRGELCFLVVCESSEPLYQTEMDDMFKSVKEGEPGFLQLGMGNARDPILCKLLSIGRGQESPTLLRVWNRILVVEAFWGVFLVITFLCTGLYFWLMYEHWQIHPAIIVVVLLLNFPLGPLAIRMCLNKRWTNFKENHVKRIMGVMQSEIDNEIKRLLVNRATVKVTCRQADTNGTIQVNSAELELLVFVNKSYFQSPLLCKLVKPGTHCTALPPT